MYLYHEQIRTMEIRAAGWLVEGVWIVGAVFCIRYQLRK